MIRLQVSMALVLAGCAGKLANPSDGDGDAPDARTGDGDAPPGDDPPTGSLASQYPGDVGIGGDPNVVFFDDFERDSIQAAQAIYSDEYILNSDLMQLVDDVPAASPGSKSLVMNTVPGRHSTAIFKLLPDDYDELWLRYYIKYPAGGAWHHTGIWMGGYIERYNFGYPRAGDLPAGDDRVSFAVEPSGTAAGSTGPNPLVDLYMYWMKMRAGGDGMYWGNSAIQKDSFRNDDDQWMCLELHVKLNEDPNSAAGAEIDVWKNDQLIRRFEADNPVGDWLWGGFCPHDADTAFCTDYAPNGPTNVPLDMQFRKTTDLKLNHIWPQNDNQIGSSSLYFDHIVVAQRRIGCIVP